jgi:hypothetical protein
MISEVVRTVKMLHCVTEIIWQSIGPLFCNNNNNNNNKLFIYLTASGLLPGGSGYYAYT